MREAFRSAFVGIGKVGGKEAKVYDSVAAAVAARSVGIFSMSAAACEALVRRGGVEDDDGKFRFTHDTRSNVSYMLQVLTSAQGLHLLEYVPPSLLLCAGRSTGDTWRHVATRGDTARHVARASMSSWHRSGRKLRPAWASAWSRRRATTCTQMSRRRFPL